MNTRYQTRGVLAGAYTEQNPKSRLTHLADVEINGGADYNTAMCKRVKADNLVDEYSDPPSLYLRPTCAICAKKWDKLQAETPAT